MPTESEYPHSYKVQRRREKEAKESREDLLAKGSKLPPICGYTYRPRKPRNAPEFDTAIATCYRRAGAGTEHEGNGFCDYHDVKAQKDSGKRTTTNQVKQARDIAYSRAKFFGNPKPTDPHTALMDEIARTAGVVAWLEDKLQNLKEDGEPDDVILKEYSIKHGFQPSVWYTMFMEERQHLVRTCTAAIKAGVAERKVQIAEQQGRIIVAMMMAFIHDKELGLDPEQIMKAPQLIRKHLLSLPQSSDTEHPAHAIIEAEVVG